MNEVWGVLGIESTTDKRKIKKAYAEAVKRCHPEEHPEEFKQLYNAYQAALGRASADNSPPRPEELQPETVQQETAQISQSLQALQSKAPQQETPYSAAMQPDSCQKTEEEPDAARAAIHRKFAQNDEKKRRALDQLTILWDAYLAKRNRRNTKALIRFIQGSEFACIRDLEPVMLMTGAIVSENRKRVNDSVLRALRSVYAAESAAAENADEKYLEESVRREISRSLKNEQNRRSWKREKVFLRGVDVLLFGGLLVFAIVLFTYAVHSTRLAKRKDHCKETVISMMDQKYPQFQFGGLLGEWEMSGGDDENTYIITAEVRRKRGGNKKGYIRVEAACDEEGNVTIINEKLTGISAGK